MFSSIALSQSDTQTQTSDQGAKSDIKEAGHSTGRTAKKTARKTKRTAKKGTHAAARKTRLGAEKGTSFRRRDSAGRKHCVVSATEEVEVWTVQRGWHLLGERRDGEGVVDSIEACAEAAVTDSAVFRYPN
jgi:hypothetical protein